MRRVLATSSIAISAGLLAASASLPAAASTSYLEQAAAALSHGQIVFVSPDTPGYNSQTVSGVVTMPGYPVALIELPATALQETGGQGQRFANELNQLTGHRDIIAMAFVDDANGTTYVTSASRGVPQGTSDHVMDQAKTAGRDPGSILSTFDQFMSETVSVGSLPAAPTPSTTSHASSTSSGTSHQSGGSYFLGVLLGVGVLAVAGTYLLLIRPRLIAGTIPGLLRQLRKVREQIRDQDVQLTIERICSHTERYLLRVHENIPSQENDARRSTRFNLEHTLKVAKGYADMERHPEEWPGDTRARRRATAGSLSKFDRDLLAAIQQANEGNRAELEVDTSVLENAAF
ncbi:MAG TPA: hypothetical protein VGH44_04430 [Candidatus Saccharimonadia bacterium]|jgi:hypothetical protein